MFKGTIGYWIEIEVIEHQRFINGEVQDHFHNQRVQSIHFNYSDIVG